MGSIIHLIGGGEIRNGDTKLIDDDIISQAPKDSVFVFFGFAAQDSMGYANTITSIYGDKYTVIIATVAKGKEFAIDSIKSAEVIYLGGGDTELLMQVFDEWGLVEHLQAAIDRGIHVVGMSAGALALSTWYIHEENDIFEIRKGWGLVPFGILVHATQASFNKAKLLCLNHGTSEPASLVAIGEGAAWRLNDIETTKAGLGNIWY